MKIAISGSVSTGKTTLGKALADKLGVAFIEENLETIFRVTQAEKNDPTKRAKLMMKCLERKRALELKEQSFVVDRCPVDILNFWFAFNLHTKVDTQPIYERCREDMALYDRVVLLPYGVLPIDRESADGGLVRSNNPWGQLQGSALISGFAHHYLEPEKIIQIPKNIVEIGARLNFVGSALEK